jgi:uncharacterized protein
MLITVNLRQLEEHGLRLTGALPLEALDLGVEDELIHLTKPLMYELEVEQLHDSLLVRGRLSLALECECSRCLKTYQDELCLDDWALHLPLEGEDKVSINNDCVDLTPFIREDILLNFPQHPLCRPDCAGLKQPASEHKAGDGSKPATDVWAGLDKLKLK